MNDWIPYSRYPPSFVRIVSESKGEQSKQLSRRSRCGGGGGNVVDVKVCGRVYLGSKAEFPNTTRKAKHKNKKETPRACV